jgi:NAD(P)-dependent dehydrogenase (short-subunit alcohol dehydrogenase family)
VNSFATGVHGMARELALDLAPIRVNAVSPGGVATPLWDSMSEEQREKPQERLGKGTCIGMIGKVEDVAEAYLKGHSVTGSLISTNGGALLK